MCPSYTQGAEHYLAPELQNWVLGWSETPCIILIHNRYFQHHQIYWSVGSRGRATCATAKTGCGALSCTEAHLKLTASFNEWIASVFPNSAASTAVGDLLGTVSFLVQLVLHLKVAPDMREVRWVLKTSLIPQAHPFLGLASPSDRRGCHALCSTSLTSCLSLPISESLSWYGLIWDFIKYKKEQRLCWLYNKSSSTLGWDRGDELLSWPWKVKLLFMLPADWCQDSIYKMLKIHMMH